MYKKLYFFSKFKISIFNQNIKGFVYIGGALIGSFIWMMFKGSSYGKGDVSELPAICSIIPNISNFPSYNSYFIAFTATYVLLPMLISSQLNWGLIAFFITLLVLDGYFHNKINIWDIAAGALMIKEAGGIVNDLNKFNINNINIKASSSAINDKMLENLSNF